MVPIFLTQWMKERRSPFLVLLFLSLSIIAALLFGSMADSKMIVDVFSDENLNSEEEASWLDHLNKSEAFEFRIRDEQQARQEVREGRSDLAVNLLTDDYRIIAAVENANVQAVEQHVRSTFVEELQLRAAAALTDDDSKFRQDVERYLQQPPLTLQAEASNGGEITSYDMGLQLRFAFTLFLVTFTIGFKVVAIPTEKTNGVWNRVILSPVSKTGMYLGHLLYSSLIGFAQISIVFLIFVYVFGFNMGERFGMVLLITALYILTMVALATLFAGMFRTPEQFYMVFPSVIPIMPLLSGVYMPPGTITNPIITAVAQIIPLTYAMEALMGVALYNTGWSDILMPVAVLLLMGVAFMGVGINLMERGKV